MSESKFKVGDKVEWTSSNVKKIGEIIAVVPADKTPVEVGYRKAGGGGLPRGHETYVIEGHRVNERGVKYGYRSLFWPVVRLLSHHEQVPSRKAMATHRHKKRGTQYVLIGVGKMQAENWRELIGEQHLVEGEEVGAAVDMREVAIYRSVDDLSLWVRPIEEFNDGRFEPL